MSIRTSLGARKRRDGAQPSPLAGGRSILCLLIAPVLVAATPPALLAPSVADLDKSLDRIESLLGRSQKSDTRWSKAQKDWLKTCVRSPCPRDVGATQILELRAAARSTRVFIQSARAEWSRAERIRSFQAVRPLIQGPRNQRREEVFIRLDRAERRFAIRLAWNERFAETWATRFAEALKRTACGP